MDGPWLVDLGPLCAHTIVRVTLPQDIVQMRDTE